MKVKLKFSKTDQFRKSSTILIGRTGTSTCSVTAMRKYLRHTSSEPTRPLFTLHNGRFLTRRDVSVMTKLLLHSKGVNPHHCSSHSYRIGAATTAAAVGIPDSLIQTLGRWRSSAYKSYIRSSPEMLCEATQLMAHHS